MESRTLHNHSDRGGAASGGKSSHHEIVLTNVRLDPEGFMQRTIFTTEHDEFRAMLRDFIAREVVPQREKSNGLAGRNATSSVGSVNWGSSVSRCPEEYGGAGSQLQVLGDRVRRGRAGRCLLRLLQRALRSGPALSARSSPARSRRIAGCRLRGRGPHDRDRDDRTRHRLRPGQHRDQREAAEDGKHYIVNGAKTFITGGVLADMMLAVCRTSPFARTTVAAACP